MINQAGDTASPGERDGVRENAGKEVM